MIFKYAQGFNQSANVAEFPYEPRMEQQPEFDTQYDSRGIAQPVGGADALLIYDFLEYEEAQTLLYFLGLSTVVPSRACTIVLPDQFRIPIYWNGVITLDVARTGRGWYDDFGLQLSGLEIITS